MLMKSHKVRPGWTRNSSLRYLVFISFPFVLLLFIYFSVAFVSLPSQSAASDVVGRVQIRKHHSAVAGKVKRGKNKTKGNATLGCLFRALWNINGAAINRAAQTKTLTKMAIIIFSHKLDGQMISNRCVSTGTHFPIFRVLVQFSTGRRSSRFFPLRRWRAIKWMKSRIC